MPTLLVQIRKEVASAEARLGELQTERGTFAAQLTEREAAEEQVKRSRGGLEAIANVNRMTEAARVQLSQTEQDINDLTTRLEGLSEQLDREELLSSLAAAASDGLKAREKLDAILGRVAASLPEPIAEAVEVYQALAEAAERYRLYGREIVPGYSAAYTLAWDAGKGGRSEVEAELKRRGYDLNAVQGEPQVMEGADIYLRAAWFVFGLVRRGLTVSPTGNLERSRDTPSPSTSSNAY